MRSSQRATSHPSHYDAQNQKLGPWGTTPAIERRFGYPAPTRDRNDDIVERLDQLEAAIAFAGLPQHDKGGPV